MGLMVWIGQWDPGGLSCVSKVPDDCRTDILVLRGQLDLIGSVVGDTVTTVREEFHPMRVRFRLSQSLFELLVSFLVMNSKY